MSQKYYLFSGDAGADYSTLRGLLQSMNILPYPDTIYTKNGNLIRIKETITLEHPVFFLYVEQTHEQGYDHNTYTIPCVVHNIHDSTTISAVSIKANLHAAMHDSEFIARSWPMEEFTYASGVYIMRPSHVLAFAGRDIHVVASAEEYAHAKKFYEEKAREFARGSARMRDYRVVVSEYIKDPLLFKGKKFHIRAYINTVATHDGLVSCSISYQNGEILTAALPYTQSDWSNRLIHDTHGETTDDTYLFPRDFPGNMDGVWPQLGQMLEEIKALCAAHRPFAQAKYSQHNFGIDIMVTAAGKIKLLEINSGAGLGDGKYRDTDAGRAYYNTFNMWLWNTGLGDICGRGIGLGRPRANCSYLTCGVEPGYFPYLRKFLDAAGVENQGHLAADAAPPARADILLVAAIDNGIQKNVWALPATIENLFDVTYAREITEKARLHDNARHFWRLTARTWNWDEFKYVSGKYIIRPSGHLWSGGDDITIIASQQDYKACKEKYDKIAQKFRVIVSDLFTDLVLFRGRKFHIRAYMLVHNYGGLTVKFAPFGKILTAAKPYVNAHYEDKDIHDTHFDSTDADYWFPEDFPARELVAPIQVQMAQMAECIKECLARGMRAYTNAQTAYEIYGVDFMVTSNGELVLIEINDMVGYNNKKNDQKRSEEFYAARAKWEWDEILSRLIRAYLSE